MKTPKILIAAASILFGTMLSSVSKAAVTGEIIFHAPSTVTHAVPDSALVFGKATSKVTLDGVMDSQEWAAAGQSAFDFNGDAAKQTQVRALYDDANLYLAFHCAEPQASKIAARCGPGKTGWYAVDAKGDCYAFEDDAIELWIAPQDDQQVVYQFIANTIQGHYDAEYHGLSADEKYTSGFKTAAKVDADSWTIEFAIPLKAIGVSKIVPGETTLRINIGRDRRVDGTQSASWQGFWGDQGKMARAFFAPDLKVAVANVSYGELFLGQNRASLKAAVMHQKESKVRLVARVKQDGKETESQGDWTVVKPGDPSTLAVEYKIANAGAVFDLTLRLESDGQAVVMSEQGLPTRPPVSRLLERKSWGAVDGPIVTFFHLNLLSASLKDYRLQAELTGDGKVLAAVTNDLKTAAGEARFVMSDQKEGDYAARLSVLDSNGKTVNTATDGAFHWTGPLKDAAAASGVIPLKLDLPATVGKAMGAWPVTVGVPFPRGALTSEANVRLLSPSGVETPVEISVPSTWDRARTSVRWLHVKFLASLEDAGKSYALEYGPNVKRAAAPSSLKADESSDAMVIDTGKLKLVCRKKPFRFLDQAWLDKNGDGKYTDDEQVIFPETNNGLFVETTDGRRYSSAADLPWPEVEKVELESRGPIEAVIRVEGWHKAAAKDQKPNRMMKYVVRIVAYAGQPMLRVFHSFILTEDYNTQYRQIAFGFNLKDADTSVVGEQSDKEYPLSAGSEAALLQVDHDAYRFQQHTSGMGPNVVKCLQSGDRSAGWLLVKRKDWGVTLATRDFWQNYCKGYEVRRDGVTFCPWPKDAGRHLSFRPEDVIAPMFAKRLAYLSDGIVCDEGNYTDFTYGYGVIDAIGVSKTHEYLLDFATAPSRDRSRLVQALLNDPPLAVVPPAYACATEVFGKIHPHDAEHYAVEEAGFKAMLARLEYGKAEDNHYGLVNFGESYQQSNETGRIMCYRTYQNSGYGIVNDFYKGYLRSGDRDWFRYAVRRARHNRDLDQRHYGPMIGAQSEYEALNWTRPVVLTFWTHYFYLLEDWYLTGDRRSWDCYQETCNEVARIISFLPQNCAVVPRDERHWFNQPLELVHMYEATWNPKYLELAKLVVDGILLAKEQTGAGKWPGQSEQMNEYLQPALLAYHQLTHDARVLKYLQDYFTEHKGEQNYATRKAQDVAAHLYWQTGDVKWLDMVGGAENMRNYMRLYETRVPPPVGGMRRYTVTETLDGLKTRKVKYKLPIYDGFFDKGFHHTWDRLWLLMAALEDARKKGILKPSTNLDEVWVGPVWDADYWKTVSPEKAKEYGWPQ